MKIAVIGMSHIGALQRAWPAGVPGIAGRAELAFVPLRRPEFAMKDSRYGPEDLQPQYQSRLAQDIVRETNGARLVALCIRGTVAHLSGLVPRPGASAMAADAIVPAYVHNRIVADIAINDRWLAFIARYVKARVAVFPPPPPIASERWIREHPGAFGERIQASGLNPPAYRLRLWQLYVDLSREQATRHGFEFLDLPGTVISGGFMDERCGGAESAHGNETYGAALICHLVETAERASTAAAPTGRRHPDHASTHGEVSGAEVSAPKIAVIGHSHIVCLQEACRDGAGGLDARVNVVQLRSAELKGQVKGRVSYDYRKVREAVARARTGTQLALLCPAGNQYFLVSMMVKPGVRDDELIERIRVQMKSYARWLGCLARFVRGTAMVLPAPPPYESDAQALKDAGRFAEKFRTEGVPPAALRLRAWRHQIAITREIAAAAGVPVFELPAGVLTENGYLREEFIGQLPHANTRYGAIVLASAFDLAGKLAQEGSLAPAAGVADGQRHPYQGLPDIAFWKQAVAAVPARELDPVGTVPYTISRSDQVATAGSCFAQHISKRIRAAGFQFLVTEAPAAGEPQAGERGYYDFSARYGNLYTARQLLQLFERAFGYFVPVESHWTLPGGRYCDPFRPRIEPEGYPSIEALEEDRRRHLAAVRKMFESLDVLVFTLGLTECWVSRLDGAALPLVPGVSGGVYDPARYAFVNFGVEEVAGDLDAFIRKLRLVNPRARLLLTVSPVPLVATYEPNHVLVSTTYSKSVLRVAADIVSRSHQGVCYFPSYEIISSHYNRGRYFGPDLRSVTEEGVDHVMAVFMRRLTDAAAPAAPVGADEEDPEAAQLNALAEAECDEEVLGRK